MKENESHWMNKIIMKTTFGGSRNEKKKGLKQAIRKV